MSKSKIQNSLLAVFVVLVFGISPLFAQDNAELTALTKQVMEAKGGQAVFGPLEELKNLYFAQKQYAEWNDFLGSLAKQRNDLGPFIDYYLALGRFQQLKYLEEKQEWGEYFDKGNDYRSELSERLDKVMAQVSPQDPLHVYAKALAWEFHSAGQDALAEAALADLLKAVSDYAQCGSLYIQPIKYAADKMLSYAKKPQARETYRVYIGKLTASVKNDAELKDAAFEFYKEANLDLSEIIYDAYLDRFLKSSSREESLPVLKEVAGLFAYKDEGLKDGAYAEKIFAKIEEIGGKDVFDEDLRYLRAFNLEQSRDYAGAAADYEDLSRSYPQSRHADEADFKAGMIAAYTFADLKKARDYFEKLAQKDNLSPQVISALYQLGLLGQWQGDLEAAKGYYDKLLAKAAGAFEDTVLLTQERLKEIAERKPIEYNLKLFLDASLKAQDNAPLSSGQVDLKASAYRLKPGITVNINSNFFGAESGCMQPQIQYLWSGHFPSAGVPQGQPAFNYAYKQSGTKEINLVVVSPGGIVAKDTVMVDVE